MPRSVVVTGSPERQRPDERIPYELTIDSSYTSPSDPVCKLFDVSGTTETDVSATKLSGSASITGQVLTSPLVIALEAGKSYRLEFQFVSGGGTYEPYLMIDGVA